MAQSGKDSGWSLVLVNNHGQLACLFRAKEGSMGKSYKCQASTWPVTDTRAVTVPVLPSTATLWVYVTVINYGIHNKVQEPSKQQKCTPQRSVGSKSKARVLAQPESTEHPSPDCTLPTSLDFSNGKQYSLDSFFFFSFLKDTNPFMTRDLLMSLILGSWNSNI